MGEDPLPKWTKGMIVWAVCVVPFADFVAWFSGGVSFREIVVCDLAFVLVIALFYLKERDRLSRLSAPAQKFGDVFFSGQDLQDEWKSASIVLILCILSDTSQEPPCVTILTNACT